LKKYTILMPIRFTFPAFVLSGAAGGPPKACGAPAPVWPAATAKSQLSHEPCKKTTEKDES